MLKEDNWEEGKQGDQLGGYCSGPGDGWWRSGPGDWLGWWPLQLRWGQSPE